MQNPNLHPEKIVFNVIKNDAVTLQMFEDGLIDVIGDCLTCIPPYAVPSLKKKWIISRESRPSTRLISFNTDKLPFHHPKIRKAFSYAINRQELVEFVGKGAHLYPQVPFYRENG